MTHEYLIDGMTCKNCVAKVKSELLKLGDVTDAEVSLDPPQAVISMSKHIPVAILQQAVGKAGHYTILEGAHHDTGRMAHVASVKEEEKNSYLPVILVFSYLTGITLLIQVFKGSFSWMEWMAHFMAGFFFVFSFFKMINLKGFAEGYRTYDILTKRLPVWGFIYPFVEMFLGIAYLTGQYMIVTSIVAFVVMGISIIGVIRSLMKKVQFQCACLGTVFRLPLGKVTLFEDLLMMVMSAVMFSAFN